MGDKVRLVLIASGSGTDAVSIMKAWREGFLPEVKIVGLISTKEDAGCIDKANCFGVYSETIPRCGKFKTQLQFDNDMYFALRKQLEAKLIFLVGCIHKIPYMPGVAMYNIHPADSIKHGGQGMYGLNVHKHVLVRILDEINRGFKKEHDRFYTYPTVHETSEKYDQGGMLMQVAVEIPTAIILELKSSAISLDEAAEELQQHVLPYEWLILPTAVRLAAKKIMDERR